jgi:hypothetical protein
MSVTAWVFILNAAPVSVIIHIIALDQAPGFAIFSKSVSS